MNDTGMCDPDLTGATMAIGDAPDGSAGTATVAVTTEPGKPGAGTPGAGTPGAGPPGAGTPAVDGADLGAAGGGSGGLPDDLDRIPPGPRLAAALAGVDPTRLAGFDLVDLLHARGRQVAHEQAQLLAVVRELAFSPPSPTRQPVRTEDWDPHAAKEIAFALSLTQHSAEATLCLALDSIIKIPAVYAALLAGHIDLPRARVICDELEDLDQDAARAVAAKVLTGAPVHLTTRQLRQRLRELVLRVDPDAVTKRYQKGVANRRVEHDSYANGTAGIYGTYLPKDKAAAAWDYIDRVARATKSRGGEQRSLDQLRADVFADLLAGVDPTTAGAATPAARKGGVTLTVELATLIGLREQAGHIDGFGPVIADIARQLAHAAADANVWRFSVTDDGRLVHHGRLRYRPTADQQAYVKARDRTCLAPGCRRPAAGCEVDHIRAWADGGPTEEFNLCCLCKAHHLAKHDAGYRLVRTDFGVLWVTPRGRAYPVTWGRDLTHAQRRLLQHLVHQTIKIRLRR